MSITFAEILKVILEKNDFDNDDSLRSVLDELSLVQTTKTALYLFNYKNRHLGAIKASINYLQVNAELKNILKQFVLEGFGPDEANSRAWWGNFVSDLTHIYPSKSAKLRSENEAHMKFRSKIEGIKSAFPTDTSVDFSPLIHFYVACKIYIERTRMGHPLPSKKLSGDDLESTLISLFDATPSELMIENEMSTTPVLAASTNGREIINHFMEDVQYATPKAWGLSYLEYMTTAQLIKKICAFLNTKNPIKNFSSNIYEDSVPYTTFRPLFIKSLIHTVRLNGAIVDSIFDPCGGWGGTILGAHISEVKKVMDADPNSALQKPKQEMIDFLLETSLQPKQQEDYILLQKGVEDLQAVDLHRFGARLDMVCVSPPFFNYERYGKNNDDVTLQSHNKYPNLIKWLSGFASPLIEKAALALREKGIFAIQVSDTSKLQIVTPFIEKILASNLFDTSYHSYPYSRYTKGNKKSYFYVFTKKQELLSMPVYSYENQQNQRNVQDVVSNDISQLTDEDFLTVNALLELKSNTGKRLGFFHSRLETEQNNDSTQPAKKLRM